MSARKTVLIVDDNFVKRKLLCDILEEDYSVLEADNGQIAMELLESQDGIICAVILDLFMPVLNGYEFLKLAGQNPAYKNLPVIVTDEDDDKENEKRALKLGAWDFFSAPYDADIIKFRLKNAIDRSQLSAFQQLKYLSEYDNLTGLYNKDKFFKETRRMIDEHFDEKFVLVRFDIDRFQLLNSFFGTREGDKLLQYVAEGIKNSVKLPSFSTYGRIESDIFCICSSTKGHKVDTLLQTIREILKDYNENYDIVPSIGIYSVEDNALPVEKMYNMATLAARACKENYVNYYAYYDKSMSENIEKEQWITNSMNTALEQEQFEVYYQPKYDLQYNVLVGAEALVRWVHPEKGMIGPGDFIPLFERNGFISRLDYYVWERVCSQLRRWMDGDGGVYPVSVNVSRANFYNPRLAEIITELVNRYRIPPALFNLEITESAYTDNPVAMQDLMVKLQEQGFIILMDDFGSGYSSLNVLKDLTVDILKIDMQFFTRTRKAGRGENIVASVIRMSKWLGIPVVAEGVETKEQVDFLNSVGCDYVQGFYYARPMPVGEYERRIQGTCYVRQSNLEESFDKDELWASNPQMEQLFSNMKKPVAVFEFSDGSIEMIRVNSAYNDCIGLENSALRRQNCLDVVAEKYICELIGAFKAAIAAEGTAECEYLRSVNGAYTMWISLHLKYINRIGNKHLLLGTLTDITDQKQMDVELKRYRRATVSDKTPVGSVQ